MQLTHCGITVELENPIDIARFKGLGYVEIAPQVPQDEKPQQELPKVKRKKAVKHEST